MVDNGLSIFSFEIHRIIKSLDLTSSGYLHSAVFLLILFGVFFLNTPLRTGCLSARQAVLSAVWGAAVFRGLSLSCKGCACSEFGCPSPCKQGGGRAEKLPRVLWCEPRKQAHPDVGQA